MKSKFKVGDILSYKGKNKFISSAPKWVYLGKNIWEDLNTPENIVKFKPNGWDDWVLDVEYMASRQFDKDLKELLK